MIPLRPIGGDYLLNFSSSREYPAVPLRPLNQEWETRCIEVALFPNQHIIRGTVMMESETRGTYVPHDGTNEAKGLLKFGSWSDDNGSITVDGPYCGFPQKQFLTIPVIVTGRFLTRMLTGLNEQAVNDLGRLLEGTVADGILDMR